MLQRALHELPPGLRDPLIAEYARLVQRFTERRWQESEMQSGRFCEIVYCVLAGYGSGSYPADPTKPRDFITSCKGLEGFTNSPRSFRLTIPRLLPGLYDIRNSRNVGHVGGDVDPSHMDASMVVGLCRWILAELVRVYHKLQPQEAALVVEALTERQVPLIWEVDGIKRVLKPEMPYGDQVLILLHASARPLSIAELKSHVEHGHITRFRDSVLRPLHTSRVIELSTSEGRVTLSPSGVARVEELLLPKWAPFLQS